MKCHLKKIVAAQFGICLLSVWFYPTSGDAAERMPGEPDAAKIYKKYCASCHASDGSGKSFRGKLVKAKNLADVEWQADVTDEHLFEVISSGKRKMPAYAKKLTADEIDSLVLYIRGFGKK